MKTSVQVLSAQECAEIHERSLKLLARSGVRVLSEGGRRILGAAGAEVEPGSAIVRFPCSLVEESIRLAPCRFSLGGRRPGWKLEMNSGICTLLVDGGAVSVLDRETGDLRPGTLDDWLVTTRLIDSIDEIGVYWKMIESGYSDSPGDFVAYWRNLLNNCSKHHQDSCNSIAKSRLLLEILQIAYGDRQVIRQLHPFSYVLCPLPPLTIDDTYTDAYLATIGVEIPVAIMPMPLMGASAPANLISTLLLANCEVLAMLCLVQTASPGTPVLYAPVPQAVEPHTWRFTGGAIENSLFGAAVTEMGRYYGLPVEASTGGTDRYSPDAQSGYERALNWVLPALVRPDILVGPGLLGGSSILCVEQMMMDVEVFRRSMHLSRGINTDAAQWLEQSLLEVGPGGNFLAQRSTSKAVRQRVWYLSELGTHESYEKWKSAGMPDIYSSIARSIKKKLDDQPSLPLDEHADRELLLLEHRAGGLDHLKNSPARST